MQLFQLLAYHNRLIRVTRHNLFDFAALQQIIVFHATHVSTQVDSSRLNLNHFGFMHLPLGTMDFGAVTKVRDVGCRAQIASQRICQLHSCIKLAMRNEKGLRNLLHAAVPG